VRREESTQSGADALSSLKDERKVRSRLFPPGGKEYLNIGRRSGWKIVVL